MDEALEQVPGLSLFRRTASISANASTQGVSLRAIAPSGTSRALVLLDGVPMNDPFGGWVIWTQLPYEDIGGAEVVRGAGAGPYGAGALTGSILLTERESSQGIADAQAGNARLLFAVAPRAAKAWATSISSPAFRANAPMDGYRCVRRIVAPPTITSGSTADRRRFAPRRRSVMC